ncbi:MAG: PepSY domain-containing protein [Bacteroidia bacterium]|nr:PepSY domain-containing protein [Bacteroidia bacterium]
MSLQKLVRRLRQFRSVHKWIGISIVFFMFITSTTGLLLGWKKNVDTLQPPTLSGGSMELSEWVSFDTVAKSAYRAIDSVTHEENAIDRFDVRIDKGIIKVLFTNGYWEVQVDAKTGKALSVAQRHADWIEHVHDGSIVGDTFKLIYTNYIGWGLLTLAISGFFLWYGPRTIRKIKSR